MIIFAVLLVAFFAFIVYFIVFANKKKNQGGDLGDHQASTPSHSDYMR